MTTLARCVRWLPFGRAEDRRWVARHRFELLALAVVAGLAWLHPAPALLAGLLAARVALDRAAERARADRRG